MVAPIVPQLYNLFFFLPKKKIKDLPYAPAARVKTRVNLPAEYGVPRNTESRVSILCVADQI
jgi:hypothetical protein